jgi:hypothetical protein
MNERGTSAASNFDLEESCILKTHQAAWRPLVIYRRSSAFIGG